MPKTKQNQEPSVTSLNAVLRCKKKGGGKEKNGVYRVGDLKKTYLISSEEKKKNCVCCHPVFCISKCESWDNNMQKHSHFRKAKRR